MTAPAPQDSTLNPALFASVAGLFIFFWASGFVAAKYGLPYAEPFTLLSCRYIVASFILIPACFMMKAAWPRTRRQAFHILVAGFLIQTVYLTGVYSGINLGVSTGVTALVVGLQPLLTGALTGIVLGERVTARNWTGLMLGFAGLALIVWDRVTAPEDTLAGMGMCIVGLVGITVGTLYQKRFCGSFDVRTGVAMQSAISCVVSVAIAASMETMKIDWTGEFVFAVLWSAVGLSVIASSLYYWMVQRGAAARVTSVIYLSPPTTAVMGWAMFGETMSWMAIGGMALAMSGVAMAVRSR